MYVFTLPRIQVSAQLSEGSLVQYLACRVRTGLLYQLWLWVEISVSVTVSDFKWILRVTRVRLACCRRSNYVTVTWSSDKWILVLGLLNLGQHWLGIENSCDHESWRGEEAGAYKRKQQGKFTVYCSLLTVPNGAEIFQTQSRLLSYSPDCGNFRCPAGAINSMTSWHTNVWHTTKHNVII